MLELENAYRASAQLLQVVNSMFDALFSSLRA
jgi:flagellar hook-associated protein FlgK